MVPRVHGKLPGLRITLAEGGEYRNEGMQWVTLRWGRMVDDYVLEDTARLAEALRRQEGAPA